MSFAITTNLIAAVIVVSGWTAAVWAVYKKLSDPYERPKARRRVRVVQTPDISSQPELVLTGRRAA